MGVPQNWLQGSPSSSVCTTSLDHVRQDNLAGVDTQQRLRGRGREWMLVCHEGPCLLGADHDPDVLAGYKAMCPLFTTCSHSSSARPSSCGQDRLLIEWNRFTRIQGIEGGAGQFTVPGRPWRRRFLPERCGSAHCVAAHALANGCFDKPACCWSIYA
jgi:hypothetical protein